MKMDKIEFSPTLTHIFFPWNTSKESISYEYDSLYLKTVGENMIATTKMRNNYVAYQSFIFPILR